MKTLEVKTEPPKKELKPPKENPISEVEPIRT
jgi:hypothetical protein